MFTRCTTASILGIEAMPVIAEVFKGGGLPGIHLVGLARGAMRESLPIGADMTAGELHDALAQQGARLMPVTLAAAARGGLTLTPQPADGVTYAQKISKAETRINWTLPAGAVHDQPGLLQGGQVRQEDCILRPI